MAVDIENFRPALGNVTGGMTGPALPLHLREDLGHLPIRDRRVFVGHGNAHVPKERDQRIGFDPKVVR